MNKSILDGGEFFVQNNGPSTRQSAMLFLPDIKLEEIDNIDMRGNILFWKDIDGCQMEMC